MPPIRVPFDAFGVSTLSRTTSLNDSALLPLILGPRRSHYQNSVNVVFSGVVL